MFYIERDPGLLPHLPQSRLFSFHYKFRTKLAECRDYLKISTYLQYVKYVVAASYQLMLIRVPKLLCRSIYLSS